MPNTNAVETLSFEQALVELQNIVSGLETGESALEQSIEAYERGIALKKHCENKLRDAQAKIEKISLTQDGNVTKQPLDPED